MRVLLIGVGTVGEAIARLSAERDWCEVMVLADYDDDRARTLADSLGGAPGFPPPGSTRATHRRSPSWPGRTRWTSS